MATFRESLNQIMQRRKAVPTADPTACAIYTRYNYLAQREESIKE